MLLEIEVRQIPPDLTVLDCSGKIALGRESQRIETLVDECVAKGNMKVILDLTRVDYIDSAGIGLLALASGKMKESGGRLIIVTPGGRVLQLLQMTQVNAIVTVCSNVMEASATFGKQAGA